MSSQSSVPAAVTAILSKAGGLSPVRPNVPVLALESPTYSTTFIDPSATILGGKRIVVGHKDYLAPDVTLNATNGLIVIGTSTTIQDQAKLLANPHHNHSQTTGVIVGDNVLIGDGATIEGPATIGTKGGAATSIGANAIIDGANIMPGAFVGALAKVGPGVTVPTGFRVLPGANVTTNAQASNPALGYVVAATAADTTAATKQIANSILLAAGYTTLYQGSSATGGATSAGPIPAPISATGSTIFFGALNTVLGASSEPGSKNVTFEPATGNPTFLAADGTQQPIPINLAYRFPARFIGGISVQGQGFKAVQATLGKGDSIRADEGQPITIGSITKLGNNVSIHSPLGGVQGTTTTTVVTTLTDTVTGVTTTATSATTVTASSAPTATAGTTTATTTGINTAGHATTGMTVTTIAVKTTSLGSITIGKLFQAGDNVVIQGSPTQTTSIGDGVTIESGAVVIGSTIVTGSTIGHGAYISNSTVAAGTVIPDGEILINNKVVPASV